MKKIDYMNYGKKKEIQINRIKEQILSKSIDGVEIQKTELIGSNFKKLSWMDDVWEFFYLSRKKS